MGEVIVELIEYPAGAIIYRAGDPSIRAFLIRQGTVELRRVTAEAQDPDVDLGPGDVFGEMGLIDDRPHAMCARSVTAVKLLALPRAEFEELMSGVSDENSAFLIALFNRIRKLPANSSRVVTSTAIAVAPVATAIPKVETVIAHVETEIPEVKIPPRKPRLILSIFPLTRRAAAKLPRDGMTIEKFPFRIGRAAALDEDSPSDSNDLWLHDEIPYNVSRNHAMIEFDGDDFFVTDCGSSLGTFVNEKAMGGSVRRRQLLLEEGDNIMVLGNPMSPFQFRVNVAYLY